MSERPIIFSAHSVQQILAGNKDVTRRLGTSWARTKVDDLLWVKETWADAHGSVLYRAHFLTTEPKVAWRPSLFMPQRHSRITLRVVNVRKERLHTIDEPEAWREGFESSDTTSAWQAFRSEWNHLHGRGAWTRNPFVYRIEFAVAVLRPLQNETPAKEHSL